MAKLVLTMADGKELYLTKKVSGYGMLNNKEEALKELGNILKEFLLFTADDGTIIVSKQILYARIES